MYLNFFVQHILPLPGFLLLHRNIAEHLAISAASRRVSLLPLFVAGGGGGVSVPIQWLLLAGNVLTQFVCIRAVFALMAECSALTVTLVLTLRRFASLLFSIVYFGHAFGAGHWTGTICVCMGTVLFADVMPEIVRGLKGAGSGRRAPVASTAAAEEEEEKEEGKKSKQLRF